MATTIALLLYDTDKTAEKYTLCEVNVSSVSPFPESAVPHIVAAVERKLQPA